MNSLTTWTGLIAASMLAAMAGGCASSEQTVPYRTHLSVTDSLQREISGLKSQNGALGSRAAKLEEEKRLQLTTIAELESTITFLKNQLVKAPPPPAEGAADPEMEYQRALDLFRDRRYAEAGAAFRSLLDGGIGHKLQDNCRYWIGECLFGSKEYAAAIGEFQQVLAYERSEKKDESQMMIARSYAAMGSRAQAKTEYQKLIKTFPASPYLQRAKDQMSRYK